jgi:hypothetical protein
VFSGQTLAQTLATTAYDRSAAGLRLRDVAIHFFDIGADDGADEVAVAIVNGIGAKDTIFRAIAIRP